MASRIASRIATSAAALGLTIAAVAGGDSTYISPSRARIKADVGFLAADAQEGRGPGTKGIEASADYIAAAFKEAGLKPAPGAEGYFQPFSIRGDARLEGTPSFGFNGPEGKEIRPAAGTFSPLAIGSGAELAGVPIVFAGYGISAKDQA